MNSRRRADLFTAKSNSRSRNPQHALSKTKAELLEAIPNWKYHRTVDNRRKTRRFSRV